MGFLINNTQLISMKFFIAITFLVTIAVATPAFNVCQKKNEILKNAVTNLAIQNIPESVAQADCSDCYGDILQAVADCINAGDVGWLQCVQDILGATNPCINCICEIIDDICGLFGCDLNCHPTTAPSNTVPTSYIQQ